ncbi:c-type cytochrome [Thalassorhabdomicrobium marinisediminis]|uniref:Cytochrome c family protein n=1 Tax=Thalassorhabdomicrobium marinisediminis TaxID=2170577 RepID=A0A2T7FZ86_9RHOB|nr:cytochrome c family protein [Thalassorhabdomicrobium marinisediminis]PVA07487.1 cytochrome c family protein [Thalassorhabdomicrobium marinisediminis]
MFDTMTLTKVIGALCGTLLVFLLGGWAAETIYHGGGHGEHEQAYVIPVAGGDEGEEPAEEGPAFEEFYAEASAADGESLWRACSACHQLEDGANGVGPHLYGVVGRDVASVDGFNYSGSLIAVNDVWTPEELNHFLENPRGYAPGTAMTYNGMRKIEDRANLIAYLDSLDD